MSGRDIFGTDGVRGVANASLTPEFALRLARAGSFVVGRGMDPNYPFVVGRDTRLSGTMLEAAVVAGILSTGRDTLALGIVPTPGVARIVPSLPAAGGVMISASHNPIEDNGIKFFGPDGFKLSDAAERQIERLLEDDSEIPRATGLHVGVGKAAHGFVDRYFATLVEAGSDLTGITVVVDAACGAAFAVGPRAFEKLGARVVRMNCDPDGSRINVASGSTDLGPLAVRVRELTAAGQSRVVGVAFDGDADRALFVDETGATISGDHSMLALAREKKNRGTLSGNTLVGTVMSNAGLEKALRHEGIALVRAAVGDRYVLETMRAGNFTFGGEQSGHVIDLERNTTGDGPMTAVVLLSLVARERTTLHELTSAMHVFPQILVNVRAPRETAGAPDVLAAIARVERELGEDGRILVRPSGTEPLVRVMIEGDDRGRIERLANEVAETVKRAAQ